MAQRQNEGIPSSIVLSSMGLSMKKRRQGQSIKIFNFLLTKLEKPLCATFEPVCQHFYAMYTMIKFHLRCFTALWNKFHLPHIPSNIMTSK